MARLARLALGEDEIEPMARELSAVLDHIAKISELDLADVRAHLARGRGRRAPCARRARALPAARAGARAGTRGQRRGLPGTQPAGMSATDIVELSATRRRSRRSRRGRCRRAELFDAYRARAAADRAAGEDGLNCFTWVAEEAPPEGARRAPAAACRWRSRTCSAPRACPASRARASSRAMSRRTRPPSSRG